MLSKLLISFFLNILIVFIQAIDLKPIRVPSIVTEGSSIYLECKFDLEGFQLYAVKWRKNRGLFYKYQLDDPHGIKRSYPIAGVNVNLRFSNETHVFLENVDFNTQGTYSCDVISKDPFQKEVSSEDQLTVVHSDFLLSPLISKGPRFQKQIQFSSQGSAIIAPETQKEKTTTTTLKKSATYISHNHNGAALNQNHLDNLHHRLSSTIDLSKVKNLNYNQHQDYYVDKNSHLHIDQTANKKIKTVESEYFPVEFGPAKVHTDIKPHEHKVTTITKTIINSPKAKNDDSVLSQKIKLLEHLHLDHPHSLDDKQKSARIEVEEDVVPDHHHHYHHNYPHDHKLQGGVFKLTPEQYNDLKFLSRDTGDVVLFKPVSNHSLSSFSLRCQSSFIISNMLIFLTLIINYFFVKF